VRIRAIIPRAPSISSDFSKGKKRGRKKKKDRKKSGIGHAPSNIDPVEIRMTSKENDMAVFDSYLRGEGKEKGEKGERGGEST